MTNDEIIAAAHLKLQEDTRAIITDVLRDEFPAMMQQFFNNYYDVSKLPPYHLTQHLIGEIVHRSEFQQKVKETSLQAVRDKLNNMFA